MCRPVLPLAVIPQPHALAAQQMPQYDPAQISLVLTMADVTELARSLIQLLIDYLTTLASAQRTEKTVGAASSGGTIFRPV